VPTFTNPKDRLEGVTLMDGVAAPDQVSSALSMPVVGRLPLPVLAAGATILIQTMSLILSSWLPKSTLMVLLVKLLPPVVSVPVMDWAVVKDSGLAPTPY